MSFGARLRLVCAVVVASLQPMPALPDSLPVVFPLASSDSRVAAERMPARAEAVVRSQACGQEPKFARVLAELKDENYDSQGEGFATLLTAKIQWLLTQAGPCEASFVAKADEEANPVDPEDKRVAAFVARYFDDFHWTDPALNCSAGTSHVSASIVTEDNKRVYRLNAQFHAEPACLRQQINDALKLMKQDRRMGTDVSEFLPVCLLAPGDNPG